MNDDLYNRGSKRRLSDVDENERLTQRQTILNMSICKLQKDHGRKEPALLRQILIAKTVHKIEQEMDEESQINCFKNEDSYPLYAKPMEAKPIEAESKDWTGQEGAKEVVCDGADPDEIRASFADIGTAISSINSAETKAGGDDCHSIFALDATPSKQPNKFGAIGDHRKHNPHPEAKKEKMKAATSIWEDNNQLCLPMNSSPPIEHVSDVEFSFQDIDIALYDFDFMSGVPHQHDWKPLVDPFHIPMPALSCGAEADKKRGDSFFDDLDQIMQVLVGM